MDRQKLMEMMTLSISNVFETAFFQSVEIQRKEENSMEMQSFLSGELMGALLEFSGILSGTVYMVAPDLWVENLTADFLGIEVSLVTRDQKDDTIKEAVNMIAGHMFSLFDKEGGVHLGIPAIIGQPPLTREDLLKINGDIFRVMTESDALAVVAAFDEV